MGKRGFSIVELMIVALIVSALGMGVSIYMKRSSVQLRGGDQTESLRSQVQLTETTLKRELQQTALINPSCAGNAPPGLSPTANCATIPIRGGFVPYPGESQSDMNARLDFSLSTDLSADPSSLSFESDAARYALFDFDSSFQCALDPATADNPSESVNEMVAEASCTGLEVGKIYVLMEELGDRVYSNVFQITGLTGGSGAVYTIETTPGGLFNQTDPLGNSGFTNSARIYPIKLVEIAVDTNGSLFRREITPSSGDLAGYQAWSNWQSSVEGLRFQMLSITASDVISHNRTMNFSGDENNDGVEDIRGVSPRIIVKLDREHPDKLTFDNPFTAVVENDHFPRQETNFYVNFKNTN